MAIKLPKSFNKHCVATLALGSQPRQRLAKVRAKREAQESHFMLSGVQNSEGINPHTPKWILILRIKVSNGFPNIQKTILGVKIQWSETFLISLESFCYLDV
jgi:hypothetical protein